MNGHANQLDGGAFTSINDVVRGNATVYQISSKILT